MTSLETREAEPLFWTILGTVAFTGLLLPLFPETKVAAHICAGLGLFAILRWHLFSCRRHTRGFSFLAAGVLVYLVTALVYCFLPHMLHDTMEWAVESTHNYWVVARAFIIAMLSVILCRASAPRRVALQIVVLVCLMTVVASLTDHLLRGYEPLQERVFGIVGFPTQLAQVMFLGLAASLMLVALPREDASADATAADTAKCLRYCAWGLLLVGGGLILFRGPVRLPPMVPLVSDTVRLAAQAVAAVAAGGCYLWLSARGRRVLPCVMIVVFLAGSMLSGQRWHIALGILLVVACLLWLSGVRWRTTLLGLLTVAVLGGIAYVTASGRLNSVTSYRHRCMIWDATRLMIRDSWPEGWGYGTKVFRRIWPSYRADPGAYALEGREDLNVAETEKAFHAHQLWLELAAEQGVAGLVAFHVFALALMARFFRWRHRFGGWCGLTLCGLFLLEGLLHYPLFDRYNLTLFGVVYGLALSVCPPRGAEGDAG